jgi:hypothetical protein
MLPVLGVLAQATSAATATTPKEAARKREEFFTGSLQAMKLME